MDESINLKGVAVPLQSPTRVRKVAGRQTTGEKRDGDGRSRNRRGRRDGETADGMFRIHGELTAEEPEAKETDAGAAASAGRRIDICV